MKNNFGKKYFENKKKYKSYKNMEMIQNVYFPKIVIKEKIKPKSRVLDIGCAYGYFLKLCDEYGMETYGIDISRYAIEKASKITKAKLFVHDIDNGIKFFKNNFFDLIVMLDVIEHTKSPFNVLKEVYRVLKPDGKLVVTTPNINAIERFISNNNWHGFKDKTHLYLFTPTSLRFLAEKVGFKILTLETSFRPLPKFMQSFANKTGLGGQIWIVGSK
jgi:2-polyprenyl-3-methyl-5-hydroxy-6-metoxy-1,4-benzoquinol methylase